MQLERTIRWVVVGLGILVVAGAASPSCAITAVWLHVARGQGRDCDGLTGFEYFWPDNTLWSQQQVLGVDPCGNPNQILEPSNWNYFQYPDNTNLATFDVILRAPANTTLDVMVDIDTLTVESDGSLDMLGGARLNLVGGSLVNDGTITMNSDDAASAALLDLFYPAGTVISGTGTILMDRGDSGAWINAGAPVTQAAGHTIRGKGRITAPLTNHGVIEAFDTGAGGAPVLLMTIGGGQANNNILRALTGATLRIEQLVLKQDLVRGRLIGVGPGGGTRGNVELGDGAHVVGGRLEGEIDITDGTVTLESLTIVAGAEVVSVPGTTTIIRGPTLTNHGNLRPTSPAFNQITNVRFATDTMLTGSGTLSLGQFNGVRVMADTGVTVTNDVGHSIVGQGKWFAPLVNDGLIEGLSLSFENTTIENNATITTQPNGGNAFLNMTITQSSASGMLLAGTAGSMNLTSTAVINGILEDSPSATAFSGFRAHNARLIDVHNQARINVQFGSRLNIEGAVFTNDGPITVNNDSLSSGTSIEFADSVALQGSGEILLNQSGQAAQLIVHGGGVLTQAANHTIRGLGGRLDATLFVNHGTVNFLQLTNADVENHGSMNGVDNLNGDVFNAGSLGGTQFNLADINGKLSGNGALRYIQVNDTHAPGNVVGAVAVSGRYVLGAGATLEAEIGGTTVGTEYDQVQVIADLLVNPGDVQLGGVLAAKLVDAGNGLFSPSVGDSFTVLTAMGSITGNFTGYDLPMAAGGRGLTWQVDVNLHDVTLELVHALTGDYNGNGVVDAPDYTVWRDSLGQSGPGLAADGDGDQQIDHDDFIVWKAQFGMVAPGAGSSGVRGTVVPEPTAIAFVLASCLLLAAVRR